jgi:hypothetical protein
MPEVARGPPEGEREAYAWLRELWSSFVCVLVLALVVFVGTCGWKGRRSGRRWRSICTLRTSDGRTKAETEAFVGGGCERPARAIV